MISAFLNHSIILNFIQAQHTGLLPGTVSKLPEKKRSQDKSSQENWAIKGRTAIKGEEKQQHNEILFCSLHFTE